MTQNIFVVRRQENQSDKNHLSRSGVSGIRGTLDAQSTDHLSALLAVIFNDDMISKTPRNDQTNDIREPELMSNQNLRIKSIQNSYFFIIVTLCFISPFGIAGLLTLFILPLLSEILLFGTVLALLIWFLGSIILQVESLKNK